MYLTHFCNTSLPRAVVDDYCKIVLIGVPLQLSGFV